MNYEVIEEIFSYSYNNGYRAKQNEAEGFNKLKMFLSNDINGKIEADFFKGDCLSFQTFVVSCVQDRLLPIKHLGMLLRFFISGMGGGTIYNLDPEFLIHLLKSVGIENTLTDNELRFYQQMPDEFEIFRGGDFNERHRIFYSTKRKVAEAYMCYGRSPHLITGLICKKDVLLMGATERLHEIIVDRRDIRNRRLIAYKNQEGVLCEVQTPKQMTTL